MLMLGADEKKAINGIISILWRRDKEVIDMGQRRKKFAITVCQRGTMERQSRLIRVTLNW